MILKDTDAIVIRLKEWFCKNCNNYNGVKCRACEMDDALSAIDEAPTVDAEIVVRCQNCKHHGECKYADIPGWYCADGERRESE